MSKVEGNRGVQKPPRPPKGTKTGGRQKGTPNRVTKQVKDMVIAALSKAGGISYLARQAEENPGAFLSLLGRVIPTQVTGEDGGPVRITVLTGVPQPTPLVIPDAG